MQPHMTLEEVKIELSWLFTEDQIEKFYQHIAFDEYLTYDALDKAFDITENETPHYMDVEFLQAMSILFDLDNPTIYDVLTSPYGHRGARAKLYYLREDGMYCLVFFN